MSLSDKLVNINVHKEFYNIVANSYNQWTAKFNTQPIPDGMSFNDFTPTILLGLNNLPGSFDLRPWMPAPLDQGNTGACVACSVANAIHYWYKYTLGQPTRPNRSLLYIYYNSRRVNPCCYNEYSQPSVSTDSGSNICAAIQGISKFGACENSVWPFITANVTTLPNPYAYEDGQYYNQIAETRQINQDLNSIKYAISFQKYPVVCGIWIYPSFLDYNTVITGNIPYPKPNEIQLNIGHSLLLTGYNDSTKKFNVQNSYGTIWGIDGYGTIPYEYILNPTLTPNDLWIIGNGINNLI